MKIKKTLALIAAIALTVGTMAGCSKTTLSYSSELLKTEQWEATTSNIEGTVNVDTSGAKEEIKITATEYVANDQSYVDMKFTNKSGNFNIPELKAYSDGTTSYINKSFYEGIYTLNGQIVPTELANIKEEYIGIDSTASGMTINQIEALTNKSDSIVELGKLVFGNSDVDLPLVKTLVKNGRAYTMNLNTNEAVDLASKAIKAACNNMDSINNTFKLGLTADDISQIKTSVNDASFDASLNELKTTLAGSTINSKEVFTDNDYTSDFKMNLHIKDFGKISLLMKTVSAKSEVKEITLPTSKIKLTAEEFAKISTPADETIETTADTNVTIQ